MATLRELALRMATSRPGVAVRSRVQFGNSGRYWERRYARGGTSGAGSFGREAYWKAQVVNGWVKGCDASSVLDLGCGDGNQLSLADYPRYLGLDRSPTAVSTCIDRFSGDPAKSFLCYNPAAFADPAGWFRADLTLSMEVLFHLVEDKVFHDYLALLFDSADRYVIVCSSDRLIPQAAPHERHRPFTSWVAEHRPQWGLVDQTDPPEDVNLLSSMFLFSRDPSG